MTLHSRTLIVLFIVMIAFQWLHTAGIEQGHDNIPGGCVYPFLMLETKLEIKRKSALMS